MNPEHARFFCLTQRNRLGLGVPDLRKHPLRSAKVCQAASFEALGGRGMSICGRLAQEKGWHSGSSCLKSSRSGSRSAPVCGQPPRLGREAPTCTKGGTGDGHVVHVFPWWSPCARVLLCVFLLCICHHSRHAIHAIQKDSVYSAVSSGLASCCIRGLGS